MATFHLTVEDGDAVLVKLLATVRMRSVAIDALEYRPAGARPGAISITLAEDDDDVLDSLQARLAGIVGTVDVRRVGLTKNVVPLERAA